MTSVAESSSGVELDTAEASAWVRLLHGDSPGYLHVCGAGNWAGRTFTNDEEGHHRLLAYTRRLHDGGAKGVYLRSTTLTRQLGFGERGGDEDSASWPGLFADMDVAGPGHKTERLKHPLPPDLEACRKIIAEAELPEPTLWVTSGGGYYPWWLLEYPVDITDETRGALQATSERWQHVIRDAAERLGWHYGPVGDLSRVLRLPGTINRKVDDDPRRCEVMWDPDTAMRRFGDEELDTALLHAMGVRERKTPTPEPARVPAPTVYSSQAPGARPGDAFNATATWDEVLTPVGWTKMHTRGEETFWCRPGKNPRDGASATTNYGGSNLLKVFSTDTEHFEPEQTYSLFAAYAMISHQGDYGAAAKTLAGHGYGEPLTRRTVVARVPEPFNPGAVASHTDSRPAVNAPSEGEIVDAQQTMPEGRLPAPSGPMDVARELMNRGGVPWRYWQGNFYRHDGARWARMAMDEVRRELWTLTADAMYEPAPGKPLKRWQPNTNKINNLVDALKALLLHMEDPDPNIIALANGVLGDKPGELLPHDPKRFNLHALPFNFDHQAECPNWDKFLQSVLPGDTAAHNFLAEWFGYYLSGATKQQRMLSLVGPKRCGKGTIARVLTALMGADSVSSPTLGEIGGSFGEQSLIGKKLGILSDVRWKGANASEAVPILLAIIGEDSRSVRRKNQVNWEGRLPVRFLAMSNDVPTFSDASGAFACRMMHIEFKESFLGREDMDLEGKLLAELPGILNWALRGLRRLNERGRFASPDSSKGIEEEVRDNASPYRMFVNECAELEEGAEETVSDVARAYADWCARRGRTRDNHSNASLSRGVRSAFREIQRSDKRRVMPDGSKETILVGLRLPRKPVNPWIIGGH